MMMTQAMVNLTFDRMQVGGGGRGEGGGGGGEKDALLQISDMDMGLLEPERRERDGQRQEFVRPFVQNGKVGRHGGGGGLGRERRGRGPYSRRTAQRRGRRMA